MRAKLYMVISCLILLTGCCALNPQAGNCNPPCQTNCNAATNDFCSCADPGCASARCMTTTTCCQAFGNIGGTRFQMTQITEENYDNLTFVETGTYPTRYFSSSSRYKGEF